MYILITYDVATDDKAGQRRLRQVARACENVGQRVQNSVFECELTPAQLVDIRNKLLKIIDNESDSLRIYHMGSNWHHKIEQLGKEKSYDISYFRQHLRKTWKQVLDEEAIGKVTDSTQEEIAYSYHIPGEVGVDVNHVEGFSTERMSK